jgi:hypothetical protein
MARQPTFWKLFRKRGHRYSLVGQIVSVVEQVKNPKQFPVQQKEQDILGKNKVQLHLKVRFGFPHNSSLSSIYLGKMQVVTRG